MVESEDNSDQIYSVDMKSGVCSCKKGVTKAPCKHKFAVSKYFQVSQFSALPDKDIATKEMYCKIAMGYSLPRTWYRDLQDWTGDDDDNNDDTNEDLDNENADDDNNDDDNEDHHNENADDDNPPDVTSEYGQVSHDDELNLNMNEMSLEDDVPETVNEEEEDNIDEEIEEFRGTVETMLQNLQQNKSNKTYRKAFKAFKNSLKTNVSNDKKMIELMFNFAHDGSHRIQRGQKKKKNSHRMRVQQRSIARRRYKNVGTGKATSGRRYTARTHSSTKTGRKLKDAARTTLDNDKESLFNSGPSSSQSGTNPRNKHSLRSAVEGNYRNKRNHSKSMN